MISPGTYDQWAKVPMQVLVLDVETDHEDEDPSPWHGTNKMVLGGLLNAATGTYYIKSTPKQVWSIIDGYARKGPVLLVGHNIKFDLNWVYYGSGRRAHFQVSVWDTMIAAFCYWGQQFLFPSPS